MHVVLFLVLACLLHAFCPSRSAATMEQYQKDMGGTSPWNPTPEELPKIPPYCRGRIGDQREKFSKDNAKWKSILVTPGTTDATKEGWTSIHHYCAGLVALLRIDEGVGNRTALADEAQGHFEYQIRHSDPSFILMPEVHVNMGRAYLALSNRDKALESFTAAIKLKSNFTMAYLYAADTYVAMGMRPQAEELLQFGLSRSPDSDALRVRLESIRGTLAPSSPAPPPASPSNKATDSRGK